MKLKARSACTGNTSGDPAKEKIFQGTGLEKYLGGAGRLFLLFSLGFCLLSVYTGQRDAFTGQALVVGVLLFCAALLAVWKVSKLLKTDRTALILVMASALLLMGGWNLVTPAETISDYGVILEGARSMVEGTFPAEAADKTSYFCFYNFQIPYTFYVSLLMRLSGGSAMFLRAAEIMTLAVTSGVLYLTLRLFRDIPCSSFCAAVFTTFPYVFLGSGTTNNQHLALLFEALAIYVFLRPGGFWRFPVSGALLAVGELIRPTAAVILLALTIAALAGGFVRGDRREMLGALVLLLAALAVGKGADLLFRLSGLAPYGVSWSNPYFKLTLGLTGQGVTGQATTDARHTNLYYDLQAYGFDYDKYKAAAREYLGNSLKSGDVSIDYICRKMTVFAGGVDNQANFANWHFRRDHPLIKGALDAWGGAAYFICLAAGFISTLKERRPLQSRPFLLPALIFAGYFAAHIFLEVQPRYRFEMYYALMLFAAPALFDVLKCMEEKYERNA